MSNKVVVKLKRMIKSIISYFTLQWVENKFTDSVSGKTVALYRDKYGQEFHKDGRWSFFAVQVFHCKFSLMDQKGTKAHEDAVKRGAKAIADEIDQQVMEAIRRHNNVRN